MSISDPTPENLQAAASAFNSAYPSPYPHHIATLMMAAAGRCALLEKVAEAAKCIRHWHDSGEDGMVVSASHVRDLWAALDALCNAGYLGGVDE